MTESRARTVEKKDFFFYFPPVVVCVLEDGSL